MLLADDFIHAADEVIELVFREVAWYGEVVLAVTGIGVGVVRLGKVAQNLLGDGINHAGRNLIIGKRRTNGIAAGIKAGRKGIVDGDGLLVGIHQLAEVAVQKFGRRHR